MESLLRIWLIEYGNSKPFVHEYILRTTTAFVFSLPHNVTMHISEIFKQKPTSLYMIVAFCFHNKLKRIFKEHKKVLVLTRYLYKKII